MIDALNGSAYAVAIRESQIIYPLLQVIHILGVGLFAGGLLFANLRLVGVGRVVPKDEFIGYSLRVALIGFLLILFAGIQMGISFIEVFYVSDVMRLKLFVMLFILANFAYLWRKYVPAGSSAGESKPIGGGVVAILIITAVSLLPLLITLGKLLAYIGGKD